MTTLLMATDLSPRSDRALERAVAMAAVSGAALTVLHVVDEDLPPTVADAQIRAAEDALAARLRSIERAGDASVRVEVVPGRAEATIAATAERLAAALVVIGVHRDRSVADLFRGTTAERLIRARAMPVLLARAPVTGPYQRLMVAVEPSPVAARAVEMAAWLQPEGEIELVHAYQVPFEGFLGDAGTREQVADRAVAEIEAFVAGCGAATPRLRCVLQEGEVKAVLYDVVARHRPDLLVIGTHGRKGFGHAILGSVAEDILRAPPTDVLVVDAR